MPSPGWNGQDNTAVSFGQSGRSVTLDATLDPYAKAVVVTDISAGSVLNITPKNGSAVVFTGVSVGFIPPYQVVKVNTGTTCTVYTVD